MKKNQETGHSKNLANFENQINGIELIDTKYKPQSPELQIPALKTLHGNCKTILAAMSKANQDYHQVTSERELAFKPLSGLCSRIHSAMIASSATQQALDNINSIARKIRGGRAKKVSKPVTEAVPGAAVVLPEPAPKTISVSQRSFDKRTDRFEELVTALSLQSNYKPNEEDLTLESLQQLVETLRGKNSAVMKASNKLSVARDARNKALYGEGGLVAMAKKSKAYVKSVFGAKSSEYKRISRLRYANRKI